jgi:paraquat-inducible protein B
MARSKTSAKDIEYQKLLADAVALRLAKLPYDEIIAKLGHWNSIQACQKAVSSYLKRNQTKAVEDSRAEAIAILEDNIFELRAKFKQSKSVLVAREIRNQLREINLLQGNYAPTRLAHEGKDGDAAIKILVEYADDQTPPA